MKKKILPLVLISIIAVVIMASYFFIWGNGIYAKKICSLKIDFEGERYLHALYLGEINENHYYTMMTANETDNQKLTTHLICMDSRADLIFHTTVKGGNTFSAQIINEKIYMTVIEEGDGKVISATNIYNVDGSLIDSFPTQKAASTYFTLDDEIFVIFNDLFDNYLFSSYISSLDNQKMIKLGSGDMVRNICSLQDGTAIVFCNIGYIDNAGYVNCTGLNISRISRDDVLWEITVPELWQYGGGSSPYAIIGDSIVFGTMGSGVINGPAYIVDFNGNLVKADGFIQGIRSFNKDYMYQQSAYYADGDFIDVLLLNYKSVGESGHYRDFLLRLDRNGRFISRKLLKFTDERDVIWISRDKENNKRYFTVHPNKGSADFEIFAETLF